MALPCNRVLRPDDGRRPKLSDAMSSLNSQARTPPRTKESCHRLGGEHAEQSVYHFDVLRRGVMGRRTMETVCARGAAFDVHKASVSACVHWVEAAGRVEQEPPHNSANGQAGDMCAETYKLASCGPP